MRKHINFYFILILFCLIQLPQIAFATDYAIVIAGGDPNEDIAKWRDSTANIFAKLLIGRGVDEENIQTPTTEDAVEDATASLKGKLECGDNLIIYFNGHGSRQGSLIIGKEKISPSEMLKWLDKLDLPCCCKIHLVIHACHSGKFIRKMILGNTHVVTGVSSSGPWRDAHKDVSVDGTSGQTTFGGEDWPTGFNENLEKVNKDLGWQEAIQEAKKTAKDKMRDDWEKDDKPATLKRFQGHVVEIIQKKVGAPKTVILVSKEGDTLSVVLYKSKELNVGKMKVKYCYLTVSSQMGTLVEETDKGKYKVILNPVVSLNIENAWGHVEDVDRENGTIKVHFEKPKFLRSGFKTLKMNKDSIPDWVETCKWFKIEEGHLNDFFDVASISQIESPEIKFRGHVEDVENSDEIMVHIMEPAWLKCQIKQVNLKDSIPDWVEVCKWVKFAGHLDNGIIDATDFEEIKPMIMFFKGHVREVDPITKTIKFHISKPKSMWCQTKTVTNVPDEWLRNLEPCNWVWLQGYLINGNIKLQDISGIGNTQPVSVEFKGHVEYVSEDKKVIEVLISEPEQIKDQKKKVKMKNDEEIPEGVEVCKDVKIEGYMIDDTTILAENIVLLTQLKNEDAGCYRIILPDSQAIAFSTFSPEVVVKNFGLDSIADFRVTCGIDSLGTEIYRDSTLVSELHPGETANTTFNQWTTSAPGTIYEVSFMTMLENDENPKNDTLSRIVTIIPDTSVTNQPPVLSGGDVIPDSGYLLTNFTYSINYLDPDGDTPVTHEVVIDSIAYSMDSVSGTPLTGMNFQYQTMLNTVIHSFYFRFDDGNGHLVETPTYTGPIVKSFAMNRPPVLLGGDVVPDSGDAITLFSYTINYRDLDGDMPVTYEVIIDSVTYSMTFTGGTPLTGMNYQFQTILSPGWHNFYFRFDDGHGHTVLTPTYIGPMVIYY